MNTDESKDIDGVSRGDVNGGCMQKVVTRTRRAFPALLTAATIDLLNMRCQCDLSMTSLCVNVAEVRKSRDFSCRFRTPEPSIPYGIQ